MCLLLCQPYNYIKRGLTWHFTLSKHTFLFPANSVLFNFVVFFPSVSVYVPAIIDFCSTRDQILICTQYDNKRGKKTNPVLNIPCPVVLQQKKNKKNTYKQNHHIKIHQVLEQFNSFRQFHIS